MSVYVCFNYECAVKEQKCFPLLPFIITDQL